MICYSYLFKYFSQEQPHAQGVVAAWEQEGLEELFHVQGHEFSTVYCDPHSQLGKCKSKAQ